MEGNAGKKKKNTFSEGSTGLHRNLCNPLALPTKKKNPQTVYRSPPPVYVFFISPISVSISRHHHALLSMLIRVRRLNCVCRNDTLLLTANKYPCCHIPRAYICQHLCATMALALFLPPQPLIVSVGSNGLLTGLGWGNSVAGLYSEVPNLPPRKKKIKKGSSRSREVAARSLIWTLLLPEKFEQRDPAINSSSILGRNASSSRCCFAEQ